MRRVICDWQSGDIIGGEKISNFRFADDPILLAASQDKLFTLVTNLEKTSALFGLDINYSKTNVIIVDREHNNLLKLTSFGGCHVLQQARSAMTKL